MHLFSVGSGWGGLFSDKCLWIDLRNGPKLGVGFDALTFFMMKIAIMESSMVNRTWSYINCGRGNNILT